jgi:hypothetical protein
MTLKYQGWPKQQRFSQKFSCLASLVKRKMWSRRSEKYHKIPDERLISPPKTTELEKKLPEVFLLVCVR